MAKSHAQSKEMKIAQYSKDSISEGKKIANQLNKLKTQIDTNASDITNTNSRIDVNFTNIGANTANIANINTNITQINAEIDTLSAMKQVPIATGEGFALVSKPDGDSIWAKMDTDGNPMTVDYFNQHAFKNNRRGIIEFGVGFPDNTTLENDYISNEINKYCTATGVIVSTNDKCILFVEDGVTLTIMSVASTMGHVFTFDGSSWQWDGSFENVYNNPAITLGDFVSILNFASRWDGTDITIKTEGTLTVTINPATQNQFLYEQTDTQGGAAIETDNITINQSTEGKLQVIDYVSKTYSDGTFATKTQLNNISQFTSYAAADDATALTYSQNNPNILVFVAE